MFYNSVIYNINNETYFPTTIKAEPPIIDTHYKFYQSKQRQMITENRHRKEQEARLTRHRSITITGQFAAQQRIAKGYLNQLRQSLKDLNSIEPSTTMNSESIEEILPKPSTRNTTAERSTKPRIISAPVTSRCEPTTSPPAPILPLRRINSSRTTSNCHQAQQSVLNTILLHLDSHSVENASKRSTFYDIQNKFQASISPSVYRSFQRISLHS